MAGNRWWWFAIKSRRRGKSVASASWLQPSSNYYTLHSRPAFDFAFMLAFLEPSMAPHYNGVIVYNDACEWINNQTQRCGHLCNPQPLSPQSSHFQSPSREMQGPSGHCMTTMIRFCPRPTTQLTLIRKDGFIDRRRGRDWQRWMR